MSVKRTLAIGCLAVAAAIALPLLYAALFELRLTSAWHEQSAMNKQMQNIFDELSVYRKTNDKWPATLQEVVGRDMSMFTDPLNRVSDRPYLYNPKAKSGTNEIVIAQPVPANVELWPFKETWQTGITADGTYVNLAADGVGVDRLK